MLLQMANKGGLSEGDNNISGRTTILIALKLKNPLKQFYYTQISKKISYKNVSKKHILYTNIMKIHISYSKKHISYENIVKFHISRKYSKKTHVMRKYCEIYIYHRKIFQKKTYENAHKQCMKLDCQQYMFKCQQFMSIINIHCY